LDVAFSTVAMMAVDRAIQHQIRNSDVLEQQWLRNDTSDNSEDTITSRFERQAAAVSDKLAIVTEEISLTYRALDLKASRIAAALTLLPSQRDQPIMLFIQDEAARVAAKLLLLTTSLSWRSMSSFNHRRHSWSIRLPLRMIRPISSTPPVQLAGQRAWLSVTAVCYAETTSGTQ
jgi:hypothetical protein